MSEYHGFFRTSKRLLNMKDSIDDRIDLLIHQIDVGELDGNELFALESPIHSLSMASIALMEAIHWLRHEDAYWLAAMGEQSNGD